MKAEIDAMNNDASRVVQISSKNILAFDILAGQLYGDGVEITVKTNNVLSFKGPIKEKIIHIIVK